MRKMGLVLGLGMLLASAACAPAATSNGAVKAPSAKDANASDDAVTTTTFAAKVDGPSAEEVRAQAEPIPSTCEGEGAIKNAKLCVVPKTFAKKLCSGVYPEVALSMFAKGTPWTRLWLAGDVEAWNASGGRTARTKLSFDEEVVILAKHGAAQTGGIVMTGAMASYDVLRFDGSCVSVLEGELTTARPPTPKPAFVPWTRLEEATRHALLASPKVKASEAAFEKACNMADKKSCEKAERAFTQAVLEHVRSGAALPEPSRRP
jgi:hypothetical protein